MEQSVEKYVCACTKEVSALEYLYRLFKKDVFGVAHHILRDLGLAEDAIDSIDGKPINWVSSLRLTKAEINRLLESDAVAYINLATNLKVSTYDFPANF